MIAYWVIKRVNHYAKSLYANNSCHANATFVCCCHRDKAANVNSKQRWKWTQFRFSFIKHKRNFEMLNETSKHSTKFRNTQRNFARKFVTPNEISFEISRDVSRNYAKFRTCQDNSASKFRFLRNIASFRLYSSKFALIIFSQYCNMRSFFLWIISEWVLVNIIN